jgi:hypothetical protein
MVAPVVVKKGKRGTAGLEAALRLLIDHRPVRQVVRLHAPVRAAAHQPAQRIEYLAQTMPALFCVQRQSCQIRGDKVPFFIADVAWIRLTGVHTRNGFKTHPLVHNTFYKARFCARIIDKPEQGGQHGSHQ